MKRKTRSAAVGAIGALAAVLALGGCATKGDIRALQNEVRAMSLRQDSLISELRAQILQTQDTVRRQTDQVFDFRGDISQVLRQIGEAVARLEAMTADNRRAITGVRDELANVRRAPIGSPPDAADPAGAGGASTTPGDANADSQFEAALGAFNRQQFATARRGFEDFLRTYPSHLRAPDAQFNLASILTEQGNTEQALQAFLQIPELFPAADRVPNALYRAALLQIQLGRSVEAKATLERVVTSFPDSEVVVLAQDKLREIG